MTKDDFLARVSNAYDMGLLTPNRLSLLRMWVDFVLRFEGGQMSFVTDFMASEKERNGISRNMAIGNLAGDEDGYALMKLVAIFDHPCQECAIDPNAWHTRFSYCNHK